MATGASPAARAAPRRREVLSAQRRLPSVFPGRLSTPVVANVPRRGRLLERNGFGSPSGVRVGCALLPTAA
ncbi:MAG: hypothetical protein ACRDKW_08380 [Actinomycetota bacterium]